MIILLRGHIRNSFENDNLYNLIKELSFSNEITIYIHTWHIIQNSLSWREMSENNTFVNNDLIYNYFKDISHLIKLIIIDDDSKIKLMGNLEGKIMNTNCPIRGWKNLWYANYKTITYIKSMNTNHNEVVVNMRFDIFNNSNHLSHDEIINFINSNKNNYFDKNYFIINDNLFGVDNIFIGNIGTMSYLLINLYKNLDYIFDRFKFLDLRCQEHYVYYENCIGRNFNCFVYKVMNNFYDFSDNQLMDHWIKYGRYENRICILPDDFNYDYYRLSNNVSEWNNEQVIWHWYNHGKEEGWSYKLADNFNFDVYRVANNVLDWNDGQIVWHWYNHGRDQGWIYKLPDNFDMDVYRILNDFTNFTDYEIIWHWYKHGQYENRRFSF
jgi:hypothetical protein